MIQLSVILMVNGFHVQDLDATQAVWFLRAYLAEQERMPEAKDVKLEHVLPLAICHHIRLYMSDMLWVLVGNGVLLL
jgi:hypothetical protein